MNHEMQQPVTNETEDLLRELWRQALTEIEAIKPGRCAVFDCHDCYIVKDLCNYSVATLGKV